MPILVNVVRSWTRALALRGFARIVLSILRDIYWAFAGSTLKNPTIRKRPTTCLFVCLGNVCRSPFAERYAVKAATSLQIREITFVSAGLSVSTQNRPPAEAITAAQFFGVDIKEHRSTPVTAYLLARSDMIITMDASHFRYLSNNFPQFKQRLFLLPLFGDGSVKLMRGFSSLNIADPYGKPAEEFRSCYRRIIRHIDFLVLEIANKSVVVRNFCCV